MKAGKGASRKKPWKPTDITKEIAVPVRAFTRHPSEKQKGDCYILDANRAFVCACGISKTEFYKSLVEHIAGKINGLRQPKTIAWARHYLKTRLANPQGVEATGTDVD